jgi:hypothetical protein
MKLTLSILFLIFLVIQTSDDRSFYREPDKNDWPGDALSEAQFKAAVEHFTDPKVCQHPWSWALIGPNTFLLKGTSYLVERRMDATVPNIGYSHGFWGGTAMYAPIPPIWVVKHHVEAIAKEDCMYGVKP